MHRILFVLAVTVALAGCHTDTRITEHSAEFAALDPTTQHSIRQGHLRLGYTPDMVYMAVGKPAQVLDAGQGAVTWIYHQYPITAPNEVIKNGFSERWVYDPVARTSRLVVEPIDPKAFPNRVPHTLRLTFINGRLVVMKRTADW